MQSFAEQTGLTIGGERTSGQDVRSQNVTAACSIANIVKTSLGPLGLDKMMVDEVGEVTITNDGATILKMLDVEHPAARVLVQLADLQDREVGDGTTSVVIVAASLLKTANELVKHKIHPTSVIQGFRLAMREACKYMTEHIALQTKDLGKECLINCAKTSMSSKIIGSLDEKFATMVVEAMTSVKITNARGIEKYPLKSVGILKCQGQSVSDSYIVPGMALKMCRTSQAMPRVVKAVKIACIDFDLRKYKAAMGVEIVITDPKELEAIQQKELDICRDRINTMLEAGANVILTTRGIDDLALKYFVEANTIAVRRVPHEDMKRICKASGATLTVSLGDMEGEEKFDPAWLGSADEVCEERIGGDEMLLFKGMRTAKACTIVLRGANEYMLDEVERSVHDSLCVVKRTLESGLVVPGGGCVETALSIYLENFATTMGSREQLAIAAFADALLVIPRTLASNAAQDAAELVARLRAYHNKYQCDKTNTDMTLCRYGLDLLNGSTVDNVKKGVLEPMLIKMKSLQFATEAAISILRIDDCIKITPPQQEQGR